MWACDACTLSYTSRACLFRDFRNISCRHDISSRRARVYTASQCQIAFDSIRSLYVALYTLMLHFRTYIYTWAAREVSVITLLALASSECVNALISLTMNAYFSSRPLGKISHSTGLLIRARTINTNVIRYPTARFIHQWFRRIKIILYIRILIIYSQYDSVELEYHNSIRLKN